MRADCMDLGVEEAFFCAAATVRDAAMQAAPATPFIRALDDLGGSAERWGERCAGEDATDA
jgi:hypothetical protein